MKRFTQVLTGASVALVCMLMVAQAAAITPVANTVPWDPTNFAAPHTTFAGKALPLQGTSDSQGANISYDWDPGDGSAHCTGVVTNKYVIECVHTYAAAVGTAFTAVLKVCDTNAGGGCGSANFPVLMRSGNGQDAVNFAIDTGLWFEHKAMWRDTAAGQPIGGWDTSGEPCVNGFICNGSFAIDGSGAQSFEVSGHLQSGPAGDPYTEDVTRVLNRLFEELVRVNTANVSYFCNGDVSCSGVNPDSNGNGFGVRLNQGTEMYQNGQAMDAIVASGTPAALVPAGLGSEAGRNFKDVVQDMMDRYAYCMGNVGYANTIYECQQGQDNSSAQWTSIGQIAGRDGFGLSINPKVMESNALWAATTPGPSASQNADGSFGYRGTGTVWGPYADTPSGMVQAVMDQVGGTAHAGGPANAYELAESFIANNFAQGHPGPNTGNSNADIKSYYYGMFSFTKSMLLNDPAGVLTPITCLHSYTNAAVHDIDWYGAVAGQPDNLCGGGANAVTNGVAITLTSEQNPDGHWVANNVNTGAQQPFGTPWAIIMLRKAVFVSCISNLTGRGTASSPYSPARVGLVWGAQGGASSYDVLRGTASGGPYQTIGNTTATSFADTTVTDKNTYFYVVQPKNGGGGSICQSNEKSIFVP